MVLAIAWHYSTSNTLADLRARNAELTETNSLLRTIFEHAPDFLCFKDRDSRYVHFNKAFLDHFAIGDRALLRGKTDFDFFDHDLSRAAREDELEIMRNGVPLICKVERSPKADGRVTWFLTTKLPWRDETGAVAGVFVISKDITALKETEEKVEQLNRKLLETSRQAGMAEVAAGVLHNVGNVLNSVNVSASLVADQVRLSKVENVKLLSELLHANEGNLAAFLSRDPKGQMVVPYLAELSETLSAERANITSELEGLQKNVDHIKDIVAMQQSYAKVSGVSETVAISDLVEDAVRMNAASLARHDIDIVRDFHSKTVITVEKHKVIQVLVNLLRNAKYACDESGRVDKQVRIRTSAAESGVSIEVTDNGIGIAQENLTRVFAHGFTTRREGHGFGLHSGALAAKEMGGSLIGKSAGPGTGATFILNLPYKSEALSYDKS
jgi:PAS domain S-box-containing protein